MVVTFWNFQMTNVRRRAGRGAAAYRDFLALWKDTDPDIPIYKQAKTEYGKLQ